MLAYLHFLCWPQIISTSAKGVLMFYCSLEIHQGKRSTEYKAKTSQY